MGETQQTGLADGNDFFWFFRIWRRVHRFFSSCNVKLTYLFASMREPHKRDLSRFVTVKEDQEEWNEKQLLIVKLAYARKKYALLMWLMILNTTNYIYGNHFLLVAMIIRLFLFFTFSCLKCVFGLTSSVFFYYPAFLFSSTPRNDKILKKIQWKYRKSEKRTSERVFIVSRCDFVYVYCVLCEFVSVIHACYVMKLSSVFLLLTSRIHCFYTHSNNKNSL